MNPPSMPTVINRPQQSKIFRKNSRIKMEDQPHVPTMTVKASVQEDQTQEYVRRFKDWCSGKGTFHFPESSEKELIIQMSLRDFYNFKEALHINEEEDR